ncbi:serine/threonine protein kinase, partial [Agrobacterium tumefaciens]|uniref:serine/threonine protein kinase n=1 Tax=Agrobacterium tumefaciens TaxID=358 RepID=UPI003B9F32F6
APLIVGTPAYMSPEHTLRTRQGVDARSDLYSLGVTLYEMFTGTLPFDAGAAAPLNEWAHSHMARAPAPPHLVHHEVPIPVSLVILKLLDKNPSRRYQSAAGLQADLGRCADAWSRNEHIEPFELGLQDVAPPGVMASRVHTTEAPPGGAYPGGL